VSAAAGGPNALEERILVLAPTGRDGLLAGQTLGRAGLEAEVFDAPGPLATALEQGAGAVLLAEEALSPDALDLLAGVLERQPAWSDLPLVVFAAPMDRQASSARLDWMSTRLGNVTLIERPVRVATLVTALRAALRARHRQYAARATMQALETREEELKLAGERKDEFLAMLAHELRNPMAALSMALELLQLSDGDPVRTARHQGIARRQLGHLVRLVDDLLDVSRITRGAFELRKDDLDLNAVLDGALAVAQPLLETRGIFLRVARSEVPVPVHADSTRLEQVLTNLLSNSAKFTEPGGSVEVSLARTDREAVLRVRDTGRGIPVWMTDQVFEPFVQVNPGLDRSKGGLGLGLTLVKRLVQMHGGTVIATSSGAGQGSTFEVRLPLGLEQQRARSSGEPALELALSRRVLVVEDSADIRETLADFLGSLGHAVELAASGPEGVEKLLALQPDVGLVDIGLPGMDGYEVARVVRGRPEGRSLFLVALTGYGGAEAEESSRRAGFDLHLVKPVDGRRLLEILQSGEALLRERTSRLTASRAAEDQARVQEKAG
jgi:signal transduction histidine kinase/AmiR/NasT family two-component response regulator